MTPQKELLYLIGVPGAGKTTLVAEALRGLAYARRSRPFGHCVFGAGCVQLGAPREIFGGTDGLSMSVAPLVKRALVEQAWTDVLGEGDRLATYDFFDHVQGLPEWRLRVLWLDVPPAVAAERRQTRRAQQQSAAWVASRVTKVYRLARRYQAEALDGLLPLSTLVTRLQQERVIRALRGST